MAKMTIMRGLPASGKSTKAKELLSVGNTVRINKDLLRTMLHFDTFTGRNEGHTRDAARKLADWYLTNGVNVIIDDTNLNEGTVQSWKDLAKIHDAKIEYVDCTDVSVEECIERDSQREKRVGKTVIQKMALQHLGYLKGENVVICDLDGTLCDIEHRLHFVSGENKDWKSFFEHMMSDKLRTDVVAKVRDALAGWSPQAKLIFVSARPENYRAFTMDWLFDHLLGTGLETRFTALIMREAGDKRPDTLVKGDIYDKYLKDLNIVKVFDDRPSVIRMWREKGLEVEDVGKGIEF
jgi:predicted kinase